MAFKKRHTHQNPLKPNPVSERSAYPCKTTYAYPRSPLGLATNLLPLTGPGLRPNCPKFWVVRKWAGPSMPKGRLLDAIHFPARSSGASAAPQTFRLTPASYSHSTSTSLHSIGFINSFRLFFFKSKRISSKYRVATSKYHQATLKGR